jgi:hypothetical protein
MKRTKIFVSLSLALCLAAAHATAAPQDINAVQLPDFVCSRRNARRST